MPSRDFFWDRITQTKWYTEFTRLNWHPDQDGNDLILHAIPYKIANDRNAAWDLSCFGHFMAFILLETAC